MLNELPLPAFSNTISGVYDGGQTSLLQSIGVAYKRLNEAIQAFNELENAFKNLKEYTEETGLDNSVSKTLQLYIDNGTMKSLIDTKVLTDITNQLETLSKEVIRSSDSFTIEEINNLYQNSEDYITHYEIDRLFEGE